MPSEARSTARASDIERVLMQINHIKDLLHNEPPLEVALQPIKDYLGEIHDILREMHGGDMHGERTNPRPPSIDALMINLVEDIHQLEFRIRNSEFVEWSSERALGMIKALQNFAAFLHEHILGDDTIVRGPCDHCHDDQLYGEDDCKKYCAVQARKRQQLWIPSPSQQLWIPSPSHPIVFYQKRNAPIGIHGARRFR